MFNKFDDALSALHEYTSQEERGLHVAFSTLAREIFAESQRFYVPNAAFVIEGKRFDSAFQGMMRLPYDNIALLTETHIRSTGEPTWKISLAVDPNGKSKTSKIFGRLLELKFGAHMNRRGWFICSLLRVPEIQRLRPETKGWIPSPLAHAYVSFPFDREGYETRLLPITDHGLTTKEITSHLLEDIGAVMNLCAMLALKNVESEAFAPPSKLNKKRGKNSKRPLYSYHVLKVDGVRWVNEPHDGNGANGIRSHLRRGHIRRLSEDRAVWVRATMVKGSMRGFVDKDYHLLATPCDA